MVLLGAVLIASAPGADKIGSLEHLATPKLLQELSVHGSADAIIYLHRSVDTGIIKSQVESRMMAMTDALHVNSEALSDAVAEEIVNQLRLEAEVTQGNLLTFLSTDQARSHMAQQGSRAVRPFWIVNAVAVKKASKELLMEVANRFSKDIKRITDNPAIHIPERDMSAEPINNNNNHNIRDVIRDDDGVIVEQNLRYAQATDMWDLGYEGEGIVVAVVDSGIDASHPALKNNYRGNRDGDNHNHNWFDAMNGEREPYDTDNHGTHCTGSVVGIDNTVEGSRHLYGVAPKAEFIGCLCLGPDGGDLLDAIRCWEFTLAPHDLDENNPDPSRRPHISSNSWGVSQYDESFFVFEVMANILRDAGIFMVQAAGNDGPDCNTHGYPAAYQNIFSVCAVDKMNGEIAEFSSRGPIHNEVGTHVKPDVCAPGSLILSTVPGNKYATMSGTSMATPHVAGAVALLWEAIPELKRNVADTEELLKMSAKRKLASACGSKQSHPNFVYGYGNIQILDAFNMFGNMTPSPLPTESSVSDAISITSDTVLASLLHIIVLFIVCLL